MYGPFIIGTIKYNMYDGYVSIHGDVVWKDIDFRGHCYNDYTIFTRTIICA